MAKGYRSYQPDQDLLLPPSLRDWLPENQLVYLVSDMVDQLDLTGLMGEVADARVERVLVFAFERVVVADRGAAGEVTLGADRAGPVQQRLGQQGLARAGVTDEREVADVLGRMRHVNPFSGPPR